MARNLRAHAQIAAQPFCAAGQSWERGRGRGHAAASCWQMSCHREARRSWKVCHLHSSHLELLYEAAAAAASELSLPSTCLDWFIISLNYYQRGERRGAATTAAPNWLTIKINQYTRPEQKCVKTLQVAAANCNCNTFAAANETFSTFSGCFFTLDLHLKLKRPPKPKTKPEPKLEPKPKLKPKELASKKSQPKASQNTS